MPGRKSRYAEVHRDGNEPELVRLAKQLGCEVWLGAPLDGWSLFRGVWVPTEIKLPEREGLANEYTPQQKRFFSFCDLHRGPRWTWRDRDDVLRALGARVST